MTVILPEEEKSSSSLHWDDNESGFQDITEDDLNLDDDNQSKIKINLLDNNGTTDDEYHLSEDEARELFGEYVSRKSCFTRAPPLKSLVFKSLRTSNIYKYVLETFVESRSTSKDCRPFNILYDSDICLSRKEALKQSAACNLWKFDVRPKRLFVDEDVRFELSDCSYVEPCSDCFGKGFSTCTNCHGYSKRMCPYCNGTGYAFSIRTSEYNTNAPYSSEYGRNETDEGNMHMWNSAYENPQLSLRPFVTHITPNFSTATGAPAFASQHPFDRVYCTYCDGMRYIYCNDCESGKVECERCRASGSVRWFIHLSVRFNTIRDEYFNRETSIPYDLIRNAVSKRVYFEQDKKIQPLWNKLFREFKLEKASSYIINEHKYQSEASHSKIISQRHSVYKIPITLCKYEYKKKPYHFWVYGFDRHVYCTNYPKKYFLFF